MTTDDAVPTCLARPTLPGPAGCVAARGVDGRPAHAAALRFFWGPMDCGKSTMALQMNYNHARQGRRGLVTTRIDRSLGPQVTTRIGLAHEAVEVTDELDLRTLVRDAWADGVRVDYLICDEASFYAVEHVEQMADLVDSYDVDVYAFGLATDFRSSLFPAARRLFELADSVAGSRSRCSAGADARGCSTPASPTGGWPARAHRSSSATPPTPPTCGTRCSAAGTTAPVTSVPAAPPPEPEPAPRITKR